MLRIFLVVACALYTCTAQSAQLLRVGERKEAKRDEATIEAAEQRSLIDSPKKISELTDEESISGFRAMMAKMPAVTRENVSGYLAEMGHLVAVLQLPDVWWRRALMLDNPVSSLGLDQRGYLLSLMNRGGMRCWHTPVSAAHEELVVHGGLPYSLNEVVARSSAMWRQNAALFIGNMEVVTEKQFTVRNGHMHLNPYAFLVRTADNHLVELDGLAGTTVIRASADGDEWHPLLVSRDKQCLVIVAGMLVRFVSTVSWNVEHEVPIQNLNDFLFTILSYLQDPMIILGGHYYDPEKKTVGVMERPISDGCGVGMLNLSRNRLATVDIVGRLKVWNRRTQECVGSFNTDQQCKDILRASQAVNDMIELPNGHLATAGNDGTVKIWSEERNPYRDIFAMMYARERQARAQRNQIIKIASLFGCGSMAEG